jgi:putative PIN family toxin of toxin-antitoxin system
MDDRRLLVAIDTNVVIGALLGYEKSSNARVLRAIETGGLRLASSDAWLRELTDVLSHPSFAQRMPNPGQVMRVALSIGIMGELHQPQRYDWPSLSDLKDWWLLDLAYGVGVDCIISHDQKVKKAGRACGFAVHDPIELFALFPNL